MSHFRRLRMTYAVLGVAMITGAVVLITLITGSVPHDLVAILAGVTGYLVREVHITPDQPAQPEGEDTHPPYPRRLAMAERVFVRPGVKAAPPRARRPRPPATVGTTGRVTIQVDPGLGAAGSNLAQLVLGRAEDDYTRVAALFALPNPPNVVVLIEQLSPASDGTGGAWHQTCQDTTLHCDADLSNADRTCALWIAEFVEVLSALQAGGWDCGNTNGEGISRVIAEWAYPGALADYSTAAAWLDGTRPDYVSQQQGTDTDPESNGCAVLYLWWLVSLGYDLVAIVGQADATLEKTGYRVAGEAASWETFAAAAEAAWPAGQPSGVQADNPWPDVGGGGEGGGGGGGGPGPGVALSLAGDVAAGDYLLVPVQQLRRRRRLASLTPAELDELVQLVAELLRDILGGGAPPPAGGSADGK